MRNIALREGVRLALYLLGIIGPAVVSFIDLLDGERFSFEF